MSENMFIVPLSLMVCYLGLAIAMLLRRRLKSKAERSLLIYLFALAVWNALFALSVAFPENTILTSISGHVALGGLVILAVIFLNLTHAFLKQESRYTTAWWVLGIVSSLIVVVFNPEINWLGLSSVRIWAFTIGQREIVQLFSILVWGGFTLAAIFATWRVYRETVSPMYRNHHRYWLMSLGLLITGDMLFAVVYIQSYVRLLGGAINLASALVAAQAILSYRLVDIKSLYRRAFGYVTVTLLAIAINLVAIGVAFRIFADQIFFGALIGVGMTAIIFSFTLSPVRNAIQRFVDRRLFHVGIDYEIALRNYGEQVIERLRLDSLADLVMETLDATTHTDHSGLYLIQEGKHEIGGQLLYLIRREDNLPAGDFELHPDSALAKQLNDSSAPLTLYEIDVRDDLASTPTAEREWLRELMIEVIIPIHTPSKLVGLIVLGAKASGESYSTSEIEWLGAFAAQTAVALENARLFDRVESMSVNVMQLNADLQWALQQLQQVDRLKSAFIGIITHELRSPFVAAGFSVELLHRYADAGMMEDLQTQIEQLSKELSQGRRMIDSVISFASLLSKQGELHLTETNLPELLQSTLVPLEKMAQSRSISFVTSCSSRIAPIQADETRLSEAIYHLVHNAVKFNSEGGSVHVSCWPTDTHVVLRVQDTGHGIPPEKLASIWEVFTQAADDVKRGVEGLGLGLAVVKFVVEAHHGEVWASSKYGEGSTFGFRVPQRPAAEGVLETA